MAVTPAYKALQNGFKNLSSPTKIMSGYHLRFVRQNLIQLMDDEYKATGLASLRTIRDWANELRESGVLMNPITALINKIKKDEEGRNNLSRLVPLFFNSPEANAYIDRPHVLGLFIKDVFEKDSALPPIDMFIYGLRLFTHGEVGHAKAAADRLKAYYNIEREEMEHMKSSSDKDRQEKVKEVEVLIRLRDKFIEVNNLYKFIRRNHSKNAELLKKCDQILIDYVKRNLAGPANARSNFHSRALFKLLDCFYKVETASIDGYKMYSCLKQTTTTQLKNASPVKQQSFIGAVLLANGKSMDFYDALKTDRVRLTNDHVKMICHIAEVTKEPDILRPFIEISDFLPKRLEILADIYNSLALIYGQKQDISELEKLANHLLASNENYKNIKLFKHALYRVAHFYRCCKIPLPKKFVNVLKRID